MKNQDTNMFFAVLRDNLRLFVQTVGRQFLAMNRTSLLLIIAMAIQVSLYVKNSMEDEKLSIVFVCKPPRARYEAFSKTTEFSDSSFYKY